MANAADKVTFMARRASPTERSRAAKHIPAARKGTETAVILRKLAASACVSPVAPSRSRMGSSAATVAPATKAVPRNRTARPEVATRRASSGCPAPMRVETAAPRPIVRPMQTEAWKNPTVPAKPTAAATGWWPSSEM